MSLETVVEDIRDEARARAEEIRDQAEQQADEIVSDAEDEAEQIVSRREREVERTVEQEREQRLSSANLEAKQERLAARRDAIQDVRESVEQAIAEMDEGREELTRALLDDAAAEFEESTSVQVYGRADDRELIEDVLADYDGYEFAGERDCLGGVVVESETSRLRVTNTFDSVLDGVWEDELKEISQRLFEE
jgi:V/A-type H+-transporting ATPase subunit E